MTRRAPTIASGRITRSAARGLPLRRRLAENLLSFDFGAVALGAPAPMFEFTVFNLATTAALTAGLDLDAIISTADLGAISTDLTTFGGASALGARLGKSFTAMLDTSMAGAFSVGYTLVFSDEDLPGAASVEPLTLSFTGAVVAESADFDADGDVDGADLLTWQRGLGTSGGGCAAGDANLDSSVNAADLVIWSAQFGQPASSALAVPEHSTSLCITAAILLAMLGRTTATASAATS